MAETIDIAILTVIPTEIDAIFSTFGIDKSKDLRKAGDLQYWRARIYSSINNSYLSIAVSFIYGAAGNVESAIAATMICEQLGPRLMLLVGIAAGDEKKTKIGDVIVPEVVHDVTMSVRKDSKLQPRTKSVEMDSRIRFHLKAHPINFQRLGPKLAADPAEFAALKTLAATISGLTSSHIADPVSIHDGSIVSGNTLMRDSAYFPGFQETNDERCRALEMEAAGFSRACEIMGCPWIIVRGISDFGDSRKGDEFQRFAAINASIVARELIEHNIALSLFPKMRNEASELALFESLEGAVSDAYKEKKWNFVVEIGSFLSRPLWIAGKYELRKRIGEMVEDAAAHCNRKVDRASALIDDVGWTTFILGDRNRARKAISDGLMIAKQEEEWFLCAKASRHLASIARQGGEPNLCGIRLDEANDFAAKIDSSENRREMQVSLKASTAKLLVAEERYADAIALLEEAERHFSTLGDHYRVVKIHQALGNAHAAAGQSLEARASFKRGFEQASGLGRKDEALGNATALALLFNEDKDVTGAREWASIAIELASDMRDATIDPKLIWILK